MHGTTNPKKRIKMLTYEQFLSKLFNTSFHKLPPRVFFLISCTNGKAEGKALRMDMNVLIKRVFLVYRHL